MPEDVEEAQNGGGRPEKESDEVFLEIIKERGVCSTSTVREAVEERTGWDISQMQTRRRLNNLAEKGEVVKKEEGRSYDWMLPETFDAIAPDEIFLDSFDGEMKTVEEISEDVVYNETAVLRRLQQLEREGKVTSRKPSGDAETLWVVAD
jgi:predicted ArsR family transcriptional regulator